MPNVFKTARETCTRALLLLTFTGSLQAASPISPEQEEFFEKTIRPFFATHCLECHGAEKQEMSLRFDMEESVRKGGDSGPILDTAHPENSLLIQVLNHEGDMKMPPAGKLPPAEIAHIQTWIAQGAPWPASTGPAKGTTIQDRARDHWAFKPVRAPALPAIRETNRAANPIDTFLLEKLEQKSLGFAGPADRRTLIRRATFDLLGLPPTNEEAADFEQDKRPDAFERVTDRLLASPHHGERWGRHWLDVARYSDTKGYVFVSERRYPFAFTYRDYVIRSFNEDKPYHQFVREQLAADRIAAEDKAPLAGMGFLTVGRRFLNNRHDIIDDRIDVVTRGFLGLSVSCARCHDHKYDPISITDYYSLFGVFASSDEPEARPVIGEAESADLYADFTNELGKRRGEIDKFLVRKRDEKENLLRQKLPQLLSTWHEVGGNQEDPRVPTICQEIGVNPRLAKTFIGRWKQFLDARLTPDHRIFGLWALYVTAPPDGFSNMSTQIASRLTSEPNMAAAFHPAVADSFRNTPPASMKEVVEKYGQILASGAGDVGRVLEEPGSPIKVTVDEAQATFDQGERNELTNLRNRVEELRVNHSGAPPEAMLLVDTATPQDSPVLLRGNPNRPGDIAPRRYIAFLDSPELQPFRDGSGRRELAEKIAAPDNPLTRRVLANRVWHWHFGRGLVRTTSDFGLRTEPPTHPELLDFLADDFLHADWSIKHLHRLILGSNAYQQASIDNPQGREVDPENDLLWAYRRRRVDLEEMRDALLDVTGELDTRIHGRSVPIVGQNSSNRRAVYAFVDRQNLEGFFRTFDFANPNTSVPLRFVTTVPQQALFLMNSSFVLDRSRVLARDIQQIDGSSAEHKIDAMYEQVYRRHATTEEIDAGRNFISAASLDIPSAVASTWQYGYGQVDRTTGKVVDFKPFTHWTGDRWLPGPQFPDPVESHLVLEAEGGHPGIGPHRAAIRRWIAPRTTMVKIQGRLNHPAEQGDGIEALIVSSRQGILKSWTAKHQEEKTGLALVKVEAGDTIDFVVDPRSEHSFDSFVWRVRIEDAGPRTSNTAPYVWESARDFEGPREPMSPWEKYAQVLLLTNEFSFID